MAACLPAERGLALRRLPPQKRKACQTGRGAGAPCQKPSRFRDLRKSCRGRLGPASPWTKDDFLRMCRKGPQNPARSSVLPWPAEKSFLKFLALLSAGHFRRIGRFSAAPGGLGARLEDAGSPAVPVCRCRRVPAGGKSTEAAICAPGRGACLGRRRRQAACRPAAMTRAPADGACGERLRMARCGAGRRRGRNVRGEASGPGAGRRGQTGEGVRTPSRPQTADMPREGRKLGPCARQSRSARPWPARQWPPSMASMNAPAAVRGWLPPVRCGSWPCRCACRRSLSACPCPRCRRCRRR